MAYLPDIVEAFTYIGEEQPAVAAYIARHSDYAKRLKESTKRIMAVAKYITYEPSADRTAATDSDVKFRMIFHVLRQIQNGTYSVADIESYIERRAYVFAKDDSPELRGLRAVVWTVLSDHSTGTQPAGKRGFHDAFNLLAKLYSLYMVKLVKASLAPPYQPPQDPTIDPRDYTAEAMIRDLRFTDALFELFVRGQDEKGRITAPERVHVDAIEEFLKSYITTVREDFKKGTAPREHLENIQRGIDKLKKMQRTSFVPVEDDGEDIERDRGEL